MANEVQVKFNAFDLDTGDYTIGRIDIKESKRPKLHRIPRIDGSIAEEGKRSSLKIAVTGDVIGTNYDDLRSNIDALKAALQNSIQKFTTDDDRYIKAQLESFNYKYRTMRTFATYKTVFLAHFPFWLAESETTDDRTPTSGSGYTINNPGNANARLKIEVTAPGGGISDDIQIENETMGTLLRYRGDVAAADVLEIDNRYDTDDFEVLNDGSDDHANYEGDFLELQPGNNTITFTGAAGTGVKLYYRATYM